MFQQEEVRQLAQLLITAGTDQAYPDLFGDQVMLALIARLAISDELREINKRCVGLPPRQLSLVQDFIHENIAVSVRLADLASLVDLSQSQFGRAFKAATGVSPHQWQMKTRVEAAKALLVEGKSSLADVALATGFSEQSHFTRVFTAMTGLSPGTWRRARLN